MMMAPIKLYLIIGLMLGLLLKGQAQLYFEPVDMGIGLNLVRDVIRDDKGYLWLGNDGLGLMRYDGLQVTRFQHNPDDSTSMSDDGVFCLYQDSRRDIWIGTRNGLNRFNYQTQRFECFYKQPHNSHSLSNNLVQSVYEDHQGVMWFTTDNGLNRLRSDGHSFDRFYVDEGDVIQNQLTYITQDQQGQFWVAGINTGIYHFNAPSGEFKFYKDPYLPANTSCGKKIFVDASNRIWIGTKGYGAAQFDRFTGTFTHLPLNDTGTGLNGTLVYDMFQESDTTLFLALTKVGLIDIT